MEWPLASKPISPGKIPFYNLHYLYTGKSSSDPTMVWGTDVDAEALEDHVRHKNESSAAVVSVAHVLLQAVGRAIARHPELNRRVVGHRIYDFREINIRMMTYNKRTGEVDVVLIKNADSVGLERIAQMMWRNQWKALRGTSLDHLDKATLRRWPHALLRWGIKGYFWLDRNFRLPKTGKIDRVSSAPVLVNYFGFPGVPPLRSYKPSNHPDESSHLSVTMGRIEPRPVVRANEVVVRPIAPLFVRADHRIADAYLLAQFVTTLTAFLTAPATMEPGEVTSEQKEASAEAA
ncbi:MAG: 2-oxo acid dehydrogenase subunit E2 [Planctomycetota bacterium]